MISRTITGTALNIASGKLVAVPVNPAPADPAIGTLVAGAPIEIPITEGALTGTIIAPATYTFTFYNGPRPLPAFAAAVPDDDSGPITIEAIIRNAAVPADVLPFVVREGDSLLNLSPGGGGDDYFLGQDETGSLEWRPFAHAHPIAEVTGLQAALAGKADDADVATVQSNLDNHRGAATLDHPDGSVTDAKIGTRTVDDADVPASDSGLVTRLFNYLANRVRAITGESSWRTSPATTLKDAKTHADSAAPHAGHLKKTPAATADNDVQASAAGYPVIRLRRHAATTDTDNLFEVRSADGNSLLMAISAKGHLGIGGSPDITALEYGLYLVARDLEMTAGNRIRERGYGSAVSFSPNSGQNIQIQAPLQVGALSALPSGQLEIVTGAATRVSEYIRLAAAQTANAVEVRSTDGATLYYALTPAGTILHSGIQSIGGNTRGSGAVDLQTVRTNATYVAAGTNSGVLSGRSNQTGNGAYCSVVVGGEANDARAQWDLVAGRSATAFHDLAFVHGDNIGSRWPASLTWGGGRLVVGFNEISRSLISLQARTTDATPTVMSALTIPAKLTGVFTGKIVARRTTGGSDFAVFDIEVIVTRDATGTGSMVTPTVTAKTNAPGYGFSWSFDTANNTLKPTVTGAAGHDVGWSGYLIEVDVQW